MKRYEHGPRLFDALVEEAEQADADLPPTAPGADRDIVKHPIVADLERLFGRKLKLKELRYVGKKVAERVGLRLERATTRRKGKLLDWFAANWAALHPKMVELGLHCAVIEVKAEESDQD
jgi:hypothetical protein